MRRYFLIEFNVKAEKIFSYRIPWLLCSILNFSEINFFSFKSSNWKDLLGSWLSCFEPRSGGLRGYRFYELPLKGHFGHVDLVLILKVFLHLFSSVYSVVAPVRWRFQIFFFCFVENKDFGRLKAFWVQVCESEVLGKSSQQIAEPLFQGPVTFWSSQIGEILSVFFCGFGAWSKFGRK